jgi:ABC-2 type transport system ATP-binding protein
VFLDESTTGLDPQAHLSFWELIAGARDEGKTVILTTHYMDEAEALWQRVAIMDHGRIIALDSPLDLVCSLQFENTIKAQFEGEVKLAALGDLPTASSVSPTPWQCEWADRPYSTVKPVLIPFA